MQLPIHTISAVHKGRMPHVQRILQIYQAFVNSEMQYNLISKFYLKLGKLRLKSVVCSKHTSYNPIMFYLSPLCRVFSQLSASVYQFILSSLFRMSLQCQK